MRLSWIFLISGLKVENYFLQHSDRGYLFLHTILDRASEIANSASPFLMIGLICKTYGSNRAQNASHLHTMLDWADGTIENSDTKNQLLVLAWDLQLHKRLIIFIPVAFISSSSQPRFLFKLSTFDTLTSIKPHSRSICRHGSSSNMGLCSYWDYSCISTLAPN